jgi:hypothetical protein
MRPWTRNPTLCSRCECLTTSKACLRRSQPRRAKPYRRSRGTWFARPRAISSGSTRRSIRSASSARRASVERRGHDQDAFPHPDPITLIERAQKIIAKGDATLAQLEAARRELELVIAAGEAETAEIADRRTIEMNALMPAAALDAALDGFDRREKQVARRVEIAKTVRAQLETRISEQREVEVEAARQARYAHALELHNAVTGRLREFLNRAAPEARALMQAYLEAEGAVAAANKDRPAGAAPLMSIEHERLGSPLKSKISERRVPWLVHNGNRIAEFGTVEAFQSGNGLWTIYRRSNAVQGDETIGPCVIAEYIEETVQRYEPVRLEALSTSLRIPEFAAPPPGLGRPERRLMPASPVLALAAG